MLCDMPTVRLTWPGRGLWLSLVERSAGGREVESSNLSSPTKLFDFGGVHTVAEVASADSAGHLQPRNQTASVTQTFLVRGDGHRFYRDVGFYPNGLAGFDVFL